MVSARKRSTQVVAITLLLVAVGGLAAVSPTVAQEDDDEQEPGSQIRLVHAVPGGPAVDVYIDGDRVLQEVDPGEVASYQEVEPGNHSIVMVAAEEPGGVVLDTEIETEERGNYTVAAAGQFEDGEAQVDPVVFLDNATQPNAEFGSIRVGHLVPNASAVTVTLNETGGVVFEDVAFGESSPYKTIPQGDYTLDIRTGGPDGEVVQTVDADLAAGEAATVLAIGSDDENETLQVLQLTDPTGPEELSPDIVPEPDGDAADDTDEEDTENETEDAENETEAGPIEIGESDVIDGDIEEPDEDTADEDTTDEDGEATDEDALDEDEAATEEEPDDEDDTEETDGEVADDEDEGEETETATPEE
ncbi:DUF4397 domain-containing protein [Halorientalis sp. IM1011]|uniref:DUF4397 domain-containing protein n=1 Tax=Halorientalis sp. IM1011 TaxID=1932360 RepID=UPI00155F5E64|nr:DUF4397 domain-containing protein [Halorientalis sp. IM1011]